MMATQHGAQYSPHIVRSVLLSPFGLGSPVPPSGPTPADWAAIVPAASTHGVLAGLQRSEHIGTAPEAIAEEISAAYYAGLTRHFRVIEFLSRLAPAFHSDGLRWAVVKGPVLAERAYPAVDLRSYSDLDVLVHPEDFGRALEILESWGGRILERNWSLARREGRGEIGVSFGPEVFVDLHWDLLVSPGLRRAVRFDTPTLLARRSTLSIAGHEIPVLDDVDALVHLCVHAALSGGHRLRWMLDIYFATHAAALVKDELERELSACIEATNSKLFVELMNRRGAAWLGDAWPGVGSAARPDAWGRFVSVVDRARNQTDWYGGRRSGRFIGAATRSTTLSSLATIGLSGVVEVRELLATRAAPFARALGRAQRPSGDPDLFRADDRPGARAEFLEMVTASARAPERDV